MGTDAADPRDAGAQVDPAPVDVPPVDPKDDPKEQRRAALEAKASSLVAELAAEGKPAACVVSPAVDRVSLSTVVNVAGVDQTLTIHSPVDADADDYMSSGRMKAQLQGIIDRVGPGGRWSGK